MSRNLFAICLAGLLGISGCSSSADDRGQPKIDGDVTGAKERPTPGAPGGNTAGPNDRPGGNSGGATERPAPGGTGKKTEKSTTAGPGVQ